MIHPALYVECRQRRRYALYGWWNEVLRAARGEEKEPVLVLHQCGSRSIVAVVRLDFLAGLLGVAKELTDEYWGEPKETVVEIARSYSHVEDVRELSVQEG